ncbi:SRPBCC family protein [Streptomyces bobili]|uniref:SRPBCC family protein n=1 Tax=Streptomyces bobili TaxID=67280 RepID=UPI0033A8EA8D
MTSTTQHYKIERSPGEIWSLLEDGWKYFAEVMGSAPARMTGEWPEAGSTVCHQVRFGPVRRSATTIVRHSQSPRSLRLEVRAGLLGTLGLDVEIRPWGDATYATVQEYPLSPNGLRSFVQSLPLMLLLRGRHHGFLFRTDEARPARSAARH